MKSVKIRFPVSILLAVLALGVLAAHPPAARAAAADAGIIALVKQRYAALKSFRAEFAQTLTHQESGKVEKRAGTLLFRRPLLVRWNTKAPHEELFLVTPKEIWNYVPEEKIAWRHPPDALGDSRPVILVLTGQAAMDRDFDVRSEGEADGLRRLRLLPKEPSPQMTEALLHVDADGLIRRVDVTDFYGNRNDVRFTSFSENASVPEKEFSFTPPRDVEVEDHTAGRR